MFDVTLLMYYALYYHIEKNSTMKTYVRTQYFIAAKLEH